MSCEYGGHTGGTGKESGFDSSRNPELVQEKSTALQSFGIIWNHLDKVPRVKKPIKSQPTSYHLISISTKSLSS